MLMLPPLDDIFLLDDLFAVIEAMDVGNPQTYVEQLVGGVWNDPLLECELFMPDNLLPGQCRFMTTSKWILVCTGVRSNRHIANVMNSTLDPANIAESARWPLFADRGSLALYERHVEPEKMAGKQIVILGHSYGGGIALALGQRIRESNPTLQVGTILVAPPRVADREECQRLGTTQVCVWQNSNDPVMSVMPTVAESGGLRSLYTVASARFADSRGQPSPVNVIDRSSFEVTRSLSPSPPRTISPIGGILEWATTLDRFTSATHSRGAYSASIAGVRRLRGQRNWPQAAPSQSASSVHSPAPLPDGDWGGNVPAIEVVQGMQVISPAPQELVTSVPNGGMRRVRGRTDVIVEGVKIGVATRGRRRREIVRSAARLKRLCGTLVEFSPNTLSGVVSKWSPRPAPSA